MKLCVLVKQVPDMESAMDQDPATGWLMAKSSRFQMSSFDAYAVEEALRVKESLPGTEVTALTIGPRRCEAVARRAIAMGCDKAAHVLVEPDRFLTGRQTASLAAAFARQKSFDLILCGVMSQDSQAGEVGPMTAALLGMPWVCAVVDIQTSQDGAARVVSEGEGGARREIRLRLPGLVTIQTTSRSPRYPALSHVLRASRQPMETIVEKETCPALGLEVFSALAPFDQTSAGEFLQGTPEEKARRLRDILRERALL